MKRTKARIPRNTGFFRGKGLHFPVGVIYCHLSHKYEKDDFCEVRSCPRASILGRSPTRRVFGTAKVGDRGQIVIPKEARDVFNIHPGDTLLILGSESQGLVVSRPEVLDRVAQEILQNTEDSES